MTSSDERYVRLPMVHAVVRSRSASPRVDSPLLSCTEPRITGRTLSVEREVGAIDETREATHETRTKSAYPCQRRRRTHAQSSHSLRGVRPAHRCARILVGRCGHDCLQASIDVSVVCGMPTADGGIAGRARSHGPIRTYGGGVALTCRVW